MLPEAGAFELVFLAAVALIVVGPKDLPVLLRKVGQFTAKMRGLAAEFRASFDEMARQSELDELRKEVDALRNGQFASNTTAQLNSHASEINDHLNASYWDASSQADPMQTFIDPHTGLIASDSAEGDETAALPPPGTRTPPLSKPPRKIAAASKATAETAEPASDEPFLKEPGKASASKAADAEPPAAAPVKTARKRAAKTAAGTPPAGPANEAAEI